MSRDDTTWDLYRDQLGFSSYSRTEVRQTITAEDFMAITLSLMIDLDHSNYFEVWGVLVSEKAKAQIVSNGVSGDLPLQMYKVPDNPSGAKNPIYADIFTNVIQPENIRPLDGTSAY